MSLVLVSQAAGEPVSLAEAKDHLRVTGADEDGLIDLLIIAAREMVESFTRRALITQTWDWAFADFSVRIEVPKAPLQSISSIVYIDGNGAAQTLASSEYHIANAGSQTIGGLIVPAYGKAWPAVRGMPGDITVRFIAGYGNAPTDVPTQIRWAMLLIIGELYARRENAIVGVPIVKVPYSAEALMLPFVSRLI